MAAVRRKSNTKKSVQPEMDTKRKIDGYD